jgi:hypothetical protein
LTDAPTETFSATGGCLCGQVRFGLTGALPPVGFCHCSKCRRVSGAGSNAVLNVRAERLVWLSGEADRKAFTLPSGWSTSFCGRCGCPAPNQGPGGRWFVPAGSLDDDPGVGVAGHIWVGSKPGWAVIGDDAPQFPEGPPPR